MQQYCAARFVSVVCFCDAKIVNFSKSGVHVLLSLYCHCFANIVKYYVLRIEYYVSSTRYEVTLIGMILPDKASERAFKAAPCTLCGRYSRFVMKTLACLPLRFLSQSRSHRVVGAVPEKHR